MQSWLSTQSISEISETLLEEFEGVTSFGFNHPYRLFVLLNFNDRIVMTGTRVFVVLGRTFLSNSELIVLVGLDRVAYIARLWDLLGSSLLLLPDVSSLFLPDLHRSLMMLDGSCLFVGAWAWVIIVLVLIWRAEFHCLTFIWLERVDVGVVTCVGHLLGPLDLVCEDFLTGLVANLEGPL